MKRALIATLATAIAVFTLVACTDQPSPSPSTSPTVTFTSPPPLTPPPPVPQSAQAGQAIQVAELDQERLRNEDPEPWARATITVSSPQTVATHPQLPKEIKPPDNGKFLLLTVRTDVTEGPFIISEQHFELVAPDGTKYPLNENYYYLQDHFVNLTDSDDPGSTPGAAEPGSGVLMYSVPAEGVAKGTKLQASLWKGQTFSWTVA